MDGEPVSGDLERLERRVDELERELERLEAANRELRRTNVRLAAERLPTLDSAAASTLVREGPAGAGPARRLRTRARSALRAVALRILR